MNFEKYRKADTIKLHGIYGDIYQESENGELINSMRSKDADWLTGKSVFAKSESFDFEKFVLQELNQHFINKLKPEAICIRDKNLSFYKQEDAEGMEDPKGEYFVSYA